MLKLSDEIKKRLEQYPRLKECVEEYIEFDGGSKKQGYLPRLVVYVRCMRLNEPRFFGFDEEWADEFYSWGTILGIPTYSTHFFITISTSILKQFLKNSTGGMRNGLKMGSAETSSPFSHTTMKIERR